jgi:type IX secretion system PorP/SprF family membrane protein
MKKKLLLLSLFTCLLAGKVLAQQDRAITHFMYDKMSINPGMTGIGIKNAICASSIYRNQWDKVNGAPNSAVLNIEGDLSQYGVPGGVGISFYHDAIAFTRQNTAVINYAYHLPMGTEGFLGIGLGIGITNLGLDPTWIPPTSVPDASLPTAFSQTKLDANFGLYFKSDDYYVGLSSTHLPAPDFNDDETVPPGTSLVGLSSARHYYMMGGYTYRNIRPGDDIEANLLVRSDVVKTSFDLGARYMWQNQLYGGLSYRLSDAVGVMLGANVFQLINGGSLAARTNSLTVGYSYDVTINKLSSVSRGSHEMMVKYCYFLPPIPVKKSHHPRWL